MLDGVQILRGLAAVLVLFHHTLEESQPLYHGNIPHALVLFGACGVDIFFVISGFIMYYTNRDRFGRKGASVDFLVRRLVRIAPLYWLCTFAIVLMHAGGLYSHKLITLSSLFKSLCFLPNANIVLGVGWTLNYEVYFYLIVSVCFLFTAARLGVIGLLASLLLIMATSRALPVGETRTFFASPIVLEFCYGFVLAFAYSKGLLTSRFAFPALCLSLIGLILGALFGPSIGTTGLASSVRFLFWGIPAALLLVPALFAARRAHLLGRILLILGNASYSIYLTHAIVLTTYAKILNMNIVHSLPRSLCILITILISLAVGLATYFLIENPMYERCKAWWKQYSISQYAGSGSKLIT